ncbi:hypothetical protein F5B20DRAFT_584134 [Whalleya microplaca]|nr:hypothetical protein F5B20DRAFT_584134 [Whalleya microplaca]
MGCSSDEALALSALLGLDAESVQEIENRNEEKHVFAAKQMARLLDEINKQPDLGIPAGIIFFPSPTLMETGVSEMHGYTQTWSNRNIHIHCMKLYIKQPTLGSTVFWSGSLE